jgi:hypothetical protein
MLPVVVGVAVTVFVAVVACVTVRRLKEPLRIWLHDRHGVRLCDERRRGKRHRKLDGSESGSILFEALVIHSLKDEAVVAEMVKQVPMLRISISAENFFG